MVGLLEVLVLLDVLAVTLVVVDGDLYLVPQLAQAFQIISVGHGQVYLVAVENRAVQLEVDPSTSSTGDASTDGDWITEVSVGVGEATPLSRTKAFHLVLPSLSVMFQ